MLRLCPLSGPHAGQPLEVLPGAALGRDAAQGARIVVDDPQLGGLHCRFVRSRGNWEVQDGGAPDGVIVNGTRVVRARLFPGDVLTLGGRDYRVAVSRSRSLLGRVIGARG